MPYTGDETCPVNVMRNLMRFNEPGPRHPLFHRSNNQPFTQEYVISSLQRLLMQANIPGHFL
jgi:hypothetical protein